LTFEAQLIDGGRSRRVIDIEIGRQPDGNRPCVLMRVSLATPGGGYVFAYLDENQAASLARGLDAAVSQLQARAVSL